MGDNFKYVSKLSFPATLDRVVSIVEENQFKVLHIHDVQATLAGKGIEHGPYKIVEFCRAPAAKKVLDTDPDIGLFLPCKATIYELHNQVHVSFMDPLIIKDYYADELGSLPNEISADIQDIINKLKNA
jgi:uncharacterized protein (DUF302 family)